jgi:hypothetical protein
MVIQLPVVLAGGRLQRLHTGDVLAGMVGERGEIGLTDLVGPTGPAGASGPVGATGSNATVRAQTGYFASPSSTGNFSITGLGFRPKVIEFVGSKNDGLQTWFFHSQGFADDAGNQNVSTLAGNFSNLWVGDTKFDRCIYLINTGRNVQVMATLVSMDVDGFTLNFTAVNPMFVVRWKAIG